MISRVLRLLSPRDSPDTITTVAGPDDTSAGDATELRWELDEDLVHRVVSFQLISSGVQSGRSGIFCIRGSLLLFWVMLDVSRSSGSLLDYY